VKLSLTKEKNRDIGAFKKVRGDKWEARRGYILKDGT
jgi:hypothetical protein